MKANLYTVDELEYIFDTNKKDFRINEKISNNHKVIFIDNFYKRPELVRKFLLEFPAPSFGYSKYSKSDDPFKYILFRSQAKMYPNTALYKTVQKILLSEFSNNDTRDRLIKNEQEASYKNEFIFNINPSKLHRDKISNKYKPNISTNSPNPVAPHFDGAYAGSVCLNTPEEVRGGTGFYRNKIYDVHDYHDFKMLSEAYNLSLIDCFKMVRNQDYIKTSNKHYITESSDYWELIDIVEFKYNRFILYDGVRYHAQYIKENWFIDYHRINQMFFFNNKKVKNNLFGI